MFLAMIATNMDYYTSLLVLLGASVSISVHEFCHIVALYLAGEDEKLAFMGRRNFTVGVYRQKVTPLKEIFVSVAGPLVPFLIGLELYFYSELQGDATLRLISYVWLANILTLLSTDGANVRNAVLALWKGRMKR
jgi:hypothetical protein